MIWIERLSNLSAPSCLMSLMIPVSKGQIMILAMSLPSLSCLPPSLLRAESKSRKSSKKCIWFWFSMKASKFVFSAFKSFS